MINKYLLLFFYHLWDSIQASLFQNLDDKHRKELGRKLLSHLCSYLPNRVVPNYENIGRPHSNVDLHFHDGKWYYEISPNVFVDRDRNKWSQSRSRYHGSFQMRTFFGKHRMLKFRTSGLHTQRPEHSAVSIQKNDCYNYYHWVHFPLAATAR